MSQFKNPLIVTCKQDFARYTAKNDGIVIDDLPWSSHKAETLIRLLNSEIPQTIDIKYGSTTLPIGIKKVFTLNEESQFWPSHLFPENTKEFNEVTVNKDSVEIYRAIRSRVKIIRCNETVLGLENSLFVKHFPCYMHLKIVSDNDIKCDIIIENEQLVNELLFSNLFKSILNRKVY